MKISFNNISLNHNLGINIRRMNVTNNLTFNNFAPLKTDTVSFSASKKLIGGDMKFAPPEAVCRQVNENAEPARFLLETVLNKYLSPFVAEKMSDDPNEKPIQSISTRRKTSSSIKEKVVSKYSKITNDETTQFSVQLVDELSKYFPLNQNTTKKDVSNEVKSIINYAFSDDIRIPPYERIDIFLEEILPSLDAHDKFNFSAVPDEKRAQIFAQIKNDLADNCDKTHHMDTRYYDPTSINGIKHYANDIVGGRIVLRDATPENTGIIFEALKAAVKDGMLNITSVENNIPESDRLPEGKTLDNYIYATNRQLQGLASEANAKLIENPSKSGYLAVHINISLTDELLKKYNGVFKGYDGEIQIIGEDVLALKKVEDMCYKLKDNKNAISADYKPFKEYFQKHYNQSPEVQKAFDDYTYALFLAQRERPSRLAKSDRFPTIEELGFKDLVPKELDYNNLKIVKGYCDLVHEDNLKKQEEALASKQSPVTKLKTKKRQEDIISLKNLIRYAYS